MQWGIHLPHLGSRVSRTMIGKYAREAERLGCHSVWVSDHVCWPRLDAIKSRYPYSEDGDFLVSPEKNWLDPIGTMFYVAAITEKVRLGSSVLILPYRQPVVTAKQLATLDVLSEGRLILGVGVGWMEEEAQILGMPWDRRGKRSDEQLELFKTLFEDPTPSYAGEFYTVPEVNFNPKPVQQPVPIWVGGATKAAFRRTARYGNAFHAAFQPLDVVMEEWANVAQACGEVGRDPAKLSLSLRVYLDPQSRMDPELSIAGSSEQMLERIAALQSAGVSHVLLDPVGSGGAEGRLDGIRAFMSDVAPHVAAAN
jgi:probable F420-dependent oxidoreductase